MRSGLGQSGSVSYGGLRARGKAAAAAFVAVLLVCTVLAGRAAAEKVHLIAFGDSLTAGYGLFDDEGFVAQLRDWMEAQGEDVRIVLAGVSGETTAGGLARLDWALTDELQGIILTLGGNDILRGIAPEEARANLKAMLEISRARGLEVLLVGVPVAANYGPGYKAAFEAIWPELAAEYGTLLYPDFFAALGEDPEARRRFLQDDGLHPNADGAARIAAAIGPSVRQLVARIRQE